MKSPAPSSGSESLPARSALRRLIGGTTALCIGLGVAIGSGIFRVPGDVAAQLGSPLPILAAWLVGGLITLAAGLVTAELATRFPEAGGEYVFLREAYGRFWAFFFGWSYTIFVVGGGAATIAVVIGEAGCQLLGWPRAWATGISSAAIVAVATLNAIGLKVGARTQNVLSVLKVLVLLAVAALAMASSGPDAAPADVTSEPASAGFVLAFAVALRQVLWCYDGTTDSVKMAEEIRDVRRALPRALIGSAVLLTAVYVGLNAAFLSAFSPREMAASRFVAGDLVARALGPAGQRVMSAVTVVVCVGSLASTTLATIRVTFALARDGLAFGGLARMSASQSPVNALAAVALISVLFVNSGSFEQVLAIYSFAAAVLFSLAYGSLLVIRARDRRAGIDRRGVFECPAGRAVAVMLIIVQAAVAAGSAWSHPRGAVGSLVLFALVAVLYAAWRRRGAD